MARPSRHRGMVPEAGCRTRGVLPDCQRKSIRRPVAEAVGEKVWEDPGASVDQMEFAEGRWALGGLQVGSADKGC